METSPCPSCGALLPAGSFCPRDGARVFAPGTFGPGATLDKYRIDAKLGEGGMGEVWSARHQTLDKLVAIKILSPQMAADARLVARFQREARAVNAIRHQSLVDIF